MSNAPVTSVDAAQFPLIVDFIGGDTLLNVIATHGLLTGRSRAWTVGDLPHITAAVVWPEYCQDEPFGYGDAAGIWRILAGLAEWAAIEVPSDIAAPLAEMAAAAAGRCASLKDGVFFVPDGSPPAHVHSAVRLLTHADVDLLAAASGTLFRPGFDVADARRLLAESTVAGAVIDGRLVGRVESYARTPTYANLGAKVLPEFRGQGLAPAAASLVTCALLDVGVTPVWNTGVDNDASLRVAKRLGFREAARDTYVVHAR